MHAMYPPLVERRGWGCLIAVRVVSVAVQRRFAWHPPVFLLQVQTAYPGSYYDVGISKQLRMLYREGGLCIMRVAVVLNTTAKGDRRNDRARVVPDPVSNWLKTCRWC